MMRAVSRMKKKQADEKGHVQAVDEEDVEGTAPLEVYWMRN